MKKIVVLVLLLLCSCPVFASDLGDGINGEVFSPQLEYTTQSEDWTMWNKLWLGGAIGGQAADVVSTDAGLKRGCVEANPLFGSSPSIPVIALVKVALIGGAWWLTKNRPELRNLAFGTLAVTGWGAAAWNSQQHCR